MFYKLILWILRLLNDDFRRMKKDPDRLNDWTL